MPVQLRRAMGAWLLAAAAAHAAGAEVDLFSGRYAPPGTSPDSSYLLLVKEGAQRWNVLIGRAGDPPESMSAKQGIFLRPATRHELRVSFPAAPAVDAIDCLLPDLVASGDRLLPAFICCVPRGANLAELQWRGAGVNLPVVRSRTGFVVFDLSKGDYVEVARQPGGAAGEDAP